MCGIAGILSIHHAAEPPDLSLRNEAALALDRGITHRGPDGQGRFESAVRAGSALLSCTLLHRRLAILDAARGAQPMQRGPATAPSAVVFNGCIYNHRDRRDALRQAGETFASSHSDTEVILPTYEREGPSWPVALEGMWAIALWDAARKTLVLSRDRAGEKPLHVALSMDGRTLLFASTPRAIIDAARVLRWPLAADRSALATWLRFGCGERAPLLGFDAVGPGEVVEVAQADGRLELTRRRFHVPAARGESSALSPADVDAMLARSVAPRLDADVPLGCFLSGGIDSGLVAAHARLWRPDLRTFTVRMPDAGYDESEAAAVTARHLGLSHTVLECRADPVRDIEHLIAQLGLPLGDSSLLPTSWLSEAARSHVTVALTGDGGDELFGGYERHRAARWLAAMRPVLAALPERLSRSAGSRSWRAKAARLGAAARGLGYADLVAVIPSAMARELAPDLQPGEGMPDALRRAGADGPHADFAFYLPCDLLTKVDTASMSVALETRAPLLSTELIDAGLATPPGVLLEGGVTKAVLRRAAQRHLPPEIVTRRKSGFALPLADWLRRNHAGLGTFVRERVLDRAAFALVERALPLRRAAIESLWTAHAQGVEDHAQRLWLLAMLACWDANVRG